MAKTAKQMRALKPVEPRNIDLQPMLNEPGINTLLLMNPRRANIIDVSHETGTQTAFLTASNTQGYIELSDFDNQLQFNNAISDVLCVLLMKGTREGFKKGFVHLSVDYFKQETSTADRKDAKKRLRNGADFLRKANVPVIDPKKKKKNIVESYINISSGVDYYDNGDLDFYFNDDYLKKLVNSFNMYYTTSVLKADARSYPYARTLGFYISLMKRINAGKPREDLIKLSTLREAGGLPSYEQIKKNGRHYERDIIKPFENNMDAIDEILWDYCTSKGKVLKKTLTDNIKPEIFFREDLYIKITWIGYPDTQPLLQAKEKQRKKAEKIKRKKAREQEEKRG
jgi:hypothetical protein